MEVHIGKHHSVKFECGMCQFEGNADVIHFKIDWNDPELISARDYKAISFLKGAKILRYWVKIYKSGYLHHQILNNLHHKVKWRNQVKFKLKATTTR